MRAASIQMFGWLVALVATNAAAQPPLETQPPLALTASDGEGLELTALTARAVIQDPLAFTELHLIFRNPEARVREGRFRITLPSGAAISRFAMKVSGAWQEGEVVEKQAARRAYEDFLHRRQDPALMETEAGNEFSARIFPIPANGEKELIISYSQELTRSAEPYRLPLLGLPRLGALDVQVRFEGALRNVVEMKKTGFRPTEDLLVPTQATPGFKVLRNQNLVAARVRPVSEVAAPEPLSRLVVLFDTSASRALGFANSVKHLAATLAQLAQKHDFELEVLAFDQSVQSVFKGVASGFQTAASHKLIERRAEGASDLSAALATLSMSSNDGRTNKRLLLVTDGIVTAGETATDVLVGAMKSLASVGFARADVLAAGGIRDDERLHALATAALPRAGVVVPSDATAEESARRISLSTSPALKVEVPGAAWVWPTLLQGMQPGDEILVYADLPANTAVEVRVGEKVFSGGKQSLSAPRPLLERAWVKARLARLEHQKATVAAQDPDLKAALTKQMIDLSVKYRVLCNHTALLVLETEADYARFQIDRRALANILTVGRTGLQVISRTGKDLPAMVAAPHTPTMDKRKAESDNDWLGANAPNNDQPAIEAEADVPAPAASAADRPNEAMKSTMASPEAPRPSVQASDGAPAATRTAARRSGRVSEQAPKGPAPLEGALAQIMNLLARGNQAQALKAARELRQRDPGDVLGIVGLGQVLEAMGNIGEAARVYGSIIDLFPGRADLRRFAAGHLEHLNNAQAMKLAVDCLTKAAADRGDHPSSHHLQAMALLQTNHPAEAFAAIETALATHYPDGRFAGADRILKEDLGLCAAAWIRAEPKRRSEILARLKGSDGTVENAPSVRFVLTWETDANDVDFHIYDGRGGHAYYSSPHLQSGGDLYADVTTGYGPECFTVRGAAAQRAYPYRLSAHYYSKGPMGYGMGRLGIIEHDGKGTLRVQSRPFVVMTDGAFLDLGKLDASAFKPLSAVR